MLLYYYNINFNKIHIIMTDIYISIDIEPHLLCGYYNVFGHFYLDHLFILYKIKCWIENTFNKSVKGICVPNQNKLSSFALDFYKMIFNNVIDNYGDKEIIEIGTILGSIQGTEKNKIYLDRSRPKLNIPDDVMANGRKLTELNKKRARELREIIWKYCDINTVSIKKSKEILIVDRKKSPRKLININILLKLLEEKGYTHKIILMENYSLVEQIRMSYSYNNILMPCSSGYTHVAFMKENSNYYELCASGFRYPNPIIFGNIYNVNTKLLFIPLNNIMPKYRNLNKHTQDLFNRVDRSPPISTNSKADIKRESALYNILLSPQCIKCFDMHHILDVNCIDHINQLSNLL